MHRSPLLLAWLLVLLPATLSAQLRPADSALHRALKLGDVPQVQALLEGSADPNITDHHGLSAMNYAASSPAVEVLAHVIRAGGEYWPGKHVEAPIITAAREGDYKQGMVLIQQGHSASELDSLGYNALFFTVARNDLPFSKLLLSKQVRIAPGGSGSYSALHHAALHDADKVIPSMISKFGADKDARDEKGWTALHYAALGGSLEATRALLEAGANPNAPDNMGKTPLHVAAGAGHHSLASALADGGAIAMIPDALGATPIHEASRTGQLSVLVNLFRTGTETNTPDGRGEVPLLLAAQNGHAMVCRALMRQGAAVELARLPQVWKAVVMADIEQVEKMVRSRAEARKKVLGIPLLCWALRSGRPEVATYLLEQGASSEEADVFGMYPIHLAVRFALNELAKELAAKPGALSLQDGRGRTPAQVAIESNRHQMLNALLSKEMLGEKDAEGRSLVHAAVQSQTSEEMLRQLFALGANPIEQDQSGKTALHLAAELGNTGAAKVILEQTENGVWKNGDVEIELTALQDNWGNTPLHLAGMNGFDELSKVLLNADADTGIRNAKGFGVLDWTLEHRAYRTASLFNKAP